MKNFSCDICKIEVGEYELSTLYEKYQPKGIEHMCKDCNKELGDAKFAMRKAVVALQDNWVRKIIKKMVNR